MYTKITQSGGRRYLQLVEGFRDNVGKVRHRVVANLGRIDDLTPQKLDPLINGLNRVLGRSENTAFDVVPESAKSYGDVFALHELWKDLGFDRALQRALRSGRREIDAEASPLSLGPCMDGSCVARGLFSFDIWSAAAMYTASKMRLCRRAP